MSSFPGISFGSKKKKRVSTERSHGTGDQQHSANVGLDIYQSWTDISIIEEIIFMIIPQLKVWINWNTCSSVTSSLSINIKFYPFRKDCFLIREKLLFILWSQHVSIRIYVKINKVHLQPCLNCYWYTCFSECYRFQSLLDIGNKFWKNLRNLRKLTRFLRCADSFIVQLTIALKGSGFVCF